MAFLPHKLYVCDILEMNRLILFISLGVMRYHRGLMHVKYALAICQNRGIMLFHTFFNICYISQMNNSLSFICYSEHVP